MGRMRRGVRLGLVAASAAVFLWIVYQGLTWDLRGGEADPDASFFAHAVERHDLRETVVATGVTEPFARVVVQSEIPGIVAAVHADDGEHVKRGEPLAELDRERMEHQAAELRAALRMERARARQDLVGRALAEADQAAREAERIEALYQRGVASVRDRDDAAHAHRLARIAVTDARAEKEAREAAVIRAEEVSRRADADLAKSVIRSPIDGVVVTRPVEVGTAVADLQNGGTVIAILADDRRLHLRADVDENEIARVRLDQRAEVRIDAFPGEVFPGVVRKVSSSGTEERGVTNFEVEIEIEPDERVRVGMSADARIVVREHSNALLVPNAGIVREGDGPRVRRLRDGSADAFDWVPVRTAYSDGFLTVVTEGLAEGDRVLVRGAAVGAGPP
jgi:HlyD family secretion protein